MNRPRQVLVASTLGFFSFCLVSMWLCMQSGEEIKLLTAEEMHLLIELEIILLGWIVSHGGKSLGFGFICSQNIESIGSDSFPREDFDEHRHSRHRHSRHISEKWSVWQRVGSHSSSLSLAYFPHLYCSVVMVTLELRCQPMEHVATPLLAFNQTAWPADAQREAHLFG